MNHKFDIEMSAIISDSVVRDMVVAAVEKQTGKKVTDIRTSYDGTKFDGYQIIFDPNEKSKVVPFKPSKEFIVTNFDEN
jgi:hypothetical protein